MRLYDAKSQQDIEFEMKFFEYNVKFRFAAKALDQGKIQINGITSKKIENRSVIRKVQK